MAENKTKEQVKAELKALLLNEEEVTAFLIAQLEEEKSKDDDYIDKQIKECKNYLEKLDGDIDKGVLDMLQEQTTPAYWKKERDDTIEYLTEKLKIAASSKITERPAYKKIVCAAIDGTGLEDKKTIEELKEAYGEELKKLLWFLLDFWGYYLNEKEGIDPLEVLKIMILGTFPKGEDPDSEAKKEVEQLTNELKDKTGYVLARREVGENVGALTDAFRENDTDAAAEIKSSFVPFKLPYTEYLTVAETEMLNIITTKKFMLDHNATEYSEEVINSLEKQDQEILDYITLVLYRNNYFYFTDRHIAVVMYKKTPTATVSDAMLEEINASLTRIQNINLPVGYISEEINKKGKRAKVKRDSKLIWLDVVKYDYDTKSTVYRIVDRPPYYDYAVQTGRLNEYKREIITRDIKGIQHDTKNTTLKQRLIRNIQALKQFNNVTMPIQEVYNILAITDAHKYPNARKKAKEMLEDLKQNDFNFSYEFKRKNGKVAGIKFIRYTDRPLEKEKDV